MDAEILKIIFSLTLLYQILLFKNSCSFKYQINTSFKDYMENLSPLQVTDTLTDNKSNQEIIDLLTSDALLEEKLEKIVSFTE